MRANARGCKMLKKHPPLAPPCLRRETLYLVQMVKYNKKRGWSLERLAACLQDRIYKTLTTTATNRDTSAVGPPTRGVSPFPNTTRHTRFVINMYYPVHEYHRMFCSVVAIFEFAYFKPVKKQPWGLEVSGPPSRPQFNQELTIIWNSFSCFSSCILCRTSSYFEAATAAQCVRCPG